MKILHLPTNSASQLQITVKAQRELGHDVRGLVIDSHPYLTRDGIEVIERVSRRRHPVRGAIATSRWIRAVLDGYRWADVIHWHTDTLTLPFELELRIASQMAKPRVVEFWGNDIRCIKKSTQDNPYLEKVFRAYPRLADSERSRRTQERFSKYGFACLVPGAELSSYVLKEFFPNPFYTHQRIDLSEFDPSYPDPSNSCPLLVHSASNPVAKGTEAVLAAIEQLRSQGFQIEFKLLTNMTRVEALSWVRRCDIFVDEFALGDHGIAGIESFAFGKPNIGYIRPSLVPWYPQNLPKVIADQDDLVEKMKPLLLDGAYRNQLGRRARSFAEEFHDARFVSQRLVSIYEQVIAPEDQALPESENNNRESGAVT